MGPIGLELAGVALNKWLDEGKTGSSALQPYAQAAHDVSTGKETPQDTRGMDLKPKNELHHLTLAISRMKNSAILLFKQCVKQKRQL